MNICPITDNFPAFFTNQVLNLPLNYLADNNCGCNY